MSDVVLQSITKKYGQVNAVNDVSMTIQQGELVAFLGPSGCGKTTTLRMIGGFVDVTSGRISVGGRDITHLPPHKRNMGFGFQNYALFPHMNVAANVAFGLEMRGLSKPDIHTKVNLALDRVKLRQFADRLPKQMSGGQQQRVALARALVIEPDVLLLDEPLSNLDANLRHEMKEEIRNIQNSLGITTIFVTHDQDEALSISDKVVVMRQGIVEQVGTPTQVFDAPRSRFVAEFMGVSNLLTGKPESKGYFRLTSGELVPVQVIAPDVNKTILALRPERIEISSCLTSAGSASDVSRALEGRIEHAVYRGLMIDYRIKTKSGLSLIARRPAPAAGGLQILPTGHEVALSWSKDAAALVSA
ncbi:ABC transporter ATP-binding protein [Pseudochrobactrum sp. sp1633]|uniref:ABC transporter ATP-binding protein n=1 Tax=Pseudochrobactrum sp. sp1633 TaxID=3036706 RepID=UPI0025A5F19B|nr:ABC transporter ATP-binding protein [Pseudochrobactrum sp. sp1633]MDM8347187.1 ABC transporter ATP-binding protein [Pseudochrobactrum sp. sp1633]